jgi:hypothetical protein
MRLMPLFESPLVPHLLGTESGVLRGHKELKPLFDNLADRKPPVRQYYRSGYLTDGRRLTWEYPRATPNGEQMDFVEAMELNRDGLIQRHLRVLGLARIPRAATRRVPPLEHSCCDVDRCFGFGRSDHRRHIERANLF